MSKYNSNIFQIAPKSERYTIQYDSGIFPKSHYDYHVFNAGRTKVLVESWYGTKISWIGLVEVVNLEPGEEYRFNVSDKPYYVTGIRICNRSDSRALVHCSSTDGYNLKCRGEVSQELDITRIAKVHVKYGVRKVAGIGDDIKSIINFFWPSKKESVWDKLIETISHLLDEVTRKEIRKILIEDIIQLNESLRRLDYDISSLTHPAILADSFMRLVENLFYFEKKFCVYKSHNPNYVNINYYLLPVYSAAVNLKFTLYNFGINHPRVVGLDDERLSRLMSYTQKLIEDPILGAVSHINTVFEDKLKLENDTCDPETVYDTFATVRTYCGINGTEFYSFWNNTLENSKSRNYNNDVITYSTHFGRPTPYQAKQLVSNEIAPPLHPRIVEKRINRIKGISVGVWRQKSSQGRAKIGGMNVIYENGDSKEIGALTKECNYIDFKGSFLRKLVAWGNGIVECLEFHFSDGRIEKIGSKDDNGSMRREFALEDHNIVGFYMSNDLPGFQGQAANISVSFQVKNRQNKASPKNHQAKKK